MDSPGSFPQLYMEKELNITAFLREEGKRAIIIIASKFLQRPAICHQLAANRNSAIYINDIPTELQDKRKAKAIKQAFKSLLAEGFIINPDLALTVK